MIRRRICYLLLLAAGGYFIMLYNFQGLRFLFCCLVCIPLVSILFLIPLRFFCRADLSRGQDTAARGEQVELWLTAENRAWIPAARIQVELYWEAPGEKAVKIRKWFCGMGRTVVRERIPDLRAVHCGCGTMRVSRARVYDWLGIFSLPIGKSAPVRVCILPVASPVPRAVEQAYSGILRETGAEREGDLMLRDFQPGDSLHRVYWKMAARGGGLQVRDFERSGSLRVFLHFTGELSAEQWDRYLDMAASLFCFLAEESRLGAGISVEAVWRQENLYLGCDVSDGESLRRWLCALLKGEAVGEFLPEEEVLHPEGGWHLEEDCRLYFGEQCIYEE